VQIKENNQNPTELFKKSIIIEVIGAGFNKAPDTSFFILRFLRILKIHRDQSYRDALSFAEYQHLAEESRYLAHYKGRQLEEHWLKRLGINLFDRHYRSSDTDSQGST